MFVDMVRETAPEITMSKMDIHIENNFSAWLGQYVRVLLGQNVLQYVKL